MTEIQKPGPDILTELPVEVSAERAQEVGVYFGQVLDQHGQPAELPVGGRHRTNMWPGRRAEFITNGQRLTVEKIEDPGIVYGHDAFPQTFASLYTRTEKKSRDGRAVKTWELGDRFIFDPSKDPSEGSLLSYKHGSTLLFVFSDKPLKPGVEGVQRAGKRGMITANVTPPTPEGIVLTLDNFLEISKRMIAVGQRPMTKIRAVGHRALHKVFQNS